MSALESGATAAEGQPVDAAASLAVVESLTATFVAVWLVLYLQLVMAAGRWYVRQAHSRLRVSTRLLRFRRVGRTLWLVDVAIVIGWRTCLAFYAIPILFIVVPAGMTIAALMLAASIVA